MKSTPKIPPLSLADVTTYQSGVVQSRAFRRLKLHFAKQLSPHGLTPMQWFAIGMVYDKGPEGVVMSDLAHELGVTLATLTELVIVLENRGIFRKRVAADQRARIVTVTTTFAPQCEVIEAQLRHALRDSLYVRLTREELTVYVRVLYKLADL